MYRSCHVVLILSDILRVVLSLVLPRWVLTLGLTRDLPQGAASKPSGRILLEIA
jgi:hypothetical protein